MRVKGGRPGIDWATAEKPAAAWVAGVAFMVLAAVQFALGAVTGALSATGVLTLLLAALWFGMAAQSSAVQRIPVPVAPPVVIDAVRPLPGEVEGPAAGWHPVAPRTTRWWTGARWTQYTGTQYGIRPSFHGALAIKRLRTVSVVLVVAGVLAIIPAVVLLLALSSGTVDPLTALIVALFACGGVLVAFLGAGLFVAYFPSRRLLVPPAEPPGAVSGGPSSGPSAYRA
jgi:hypothetical protein